MEKQDMSIVLLCVGNWNYKFEKICAMHHLECDRLMCNNSQRDRCPEMKKKHKLDTQERVQRCILCRNHLNISEKRKQKNNQIQSNKAEGRHWETKGEAESFDKRKDGEVAWEQAFGTGSVMTCFSWKMHYPRSEWLFSSLTLLWFVCLQHAKPTGMQPDGFRVREWSTRDCHSRHQMQCK